MVPLWFRTAIVNGLKNPACILQAPFSDVQDANEMRTVEDAFNKHFAILYIFTAKHFAILRIFAKKDFAISKKSSIFAANLIRIAL